MLTAEQSALLTSEPLAGPNRLARAMELAGATQVQIEAATGIGQPQVSLIKNGRYSRLSLETAQKIAAFFGVPVDVMFPAPARAEVA